MGKLKDQMIQELEIRGHHPRTKQGYIKSMESFINHFNKRPEDLDLPEIKEYQQYLIHQGYAPNTVNRHICGLRFFYVHVLKRHGYVESIIKVKTPEIIPVILSELEVAAMIDSIHSVFYKSVLMVMYSSGLRQAEVRNLTVQDIDSKRMVINVRMGKGQKDRQALLSPLALRSMRTYWSIFRIRNLVKSNYLYMPVKNSYRGKIIKSLSHTAIGYIVKSAAKAAGVKKKLHHIAFATHLQFIY